MPPISFRRSAFGLAPAATTDTSPSWGREPTSALRKDAWPRVGRGQGSHRPRHHWAIRGVPDTQGGSTRPDALQQQRPDPRPHCTVSYTHLTLPTNREV